VTKADFFVGLGRPTADPILIPRFVVAVPTATRAVPSCVAEATRLLDETPCNVMMVRLGDESWLRVSPVGLAALLAAPVTAHHA
jgi:hypothetical protein